MPGKNLVMLLLLALAACGPSWAPANAPTAPCETIEEAAYQAALNAGAASARAEVHNDGSVAMTNGPGAVQCSTYTSAQRVCRRPVDLVIAYTQADGAKLFVRVPANTEYRFNVHAAPNTCQVVLPR